MPTTHTSSIYAADTSAPRPLSRRHRALVARNDRRIAVGSREETPFGVLSCRAEGDALVVALRRGGRVVGRELVFYPADRSLLRAGAEVPEACFSIEVDEFLGTPWHEEDSTVFWAVHGLRTKGSLEGSTD